MGVSSGELKGEQAHLGWVRARSLCQPPRNTWQGQNRLLTDMGSWEQALGGGGWHSDFREGRVVGAVASVQPGRGLPSRCPRGCPGPSAYGPGPHVVPCPFMLTLRFATTIFFLFCCSFWLLLLSKTGLLTSAMGQGCYAKGRLSISRGKRIFTLVKLKGLEHGLPELSPLGDSAVESGEHHSLSGSHITGLAST